MVSLTAHTRPRVLWLSQPLHNTPMISERVTLDAQSVSRALFRSVSFWPRFPSAAISPPCRSWNSSPPPPPRPRSTKARPPPDYSWPETSRVSRGSRRSLSLTAEQIRLLSCTTPVPSCALSALCTVCDLAHSEEKPQQLLTATLPAVFVPIVDTRKGLSTSKRLLYS